MITITVLSNGRPAANVKVTVEFTHFSRIGQRTTYTNSSGIARFDTDPGNGYVYVDGREVNRDTGRVETRVFRV